MKNTGSYVGILSVLMEFSVMGVGFFVFVFFSLSFSFSFFLFFSPP